MRQDYHKQLIYCIGNQIASVGAKKLSIENFDEYGTKGALAKVLSIQ